MRGALKFLVMLSVLWCGLHIGEPALAHEVAAHDQAYADADVPSEDGDGTHKPDTKAAHSGHHHCPVAMHQRAVALQCELIPSGVVAFAQPVAALHSLSQPPPLEPPAA